MASRRYTLLLADRTTGVVRRVTVPVRDLVDDAEPVLHLQGDGDEAAPAGAGHGPGQPRLEQGRVPGRMAERQLELARPPGLPDEPLEDRRLLVTFFVDGTDANDAISVIVQKGSIQANVNGVITNGVALPDDAVGGCDQVVHTSATSAGLQRSLELLAPEGTVLDLSWYGDSEVRLSLGGAFHSHRLGLRASQGRGQGGPRNGRRPPRPTSSRRVADGELRASVRESCV